MQTTTLSPSAAAQLAAATTLLATIGLTPFQLRAILRASEIAECLDDAEDFPDSGTVEDFVEANGDNAQDEWFDEIRDAATHLQTVTL